MSQAEHLVALVGGGCIDLKLQTIAPIEGEDPRAFHLAVNNLRFEGSHVGFITPAGWELVVRTRGLGIEMRGRQIQKEAA